MRSLALVVLAVAAVASAQQPLQFFDNDVIEDLQKLVDYTTKMKLKMLEDNYSMPRSQKKQEFEQILSSQSQQIQDAFNQKYTYEATKEQYKDAQTQQRMQWMPPAVASALQQIMDAKNDMSLSDMQFWQKKREIWGKLSYADRRHLNSGSSEDFD